MKRLLALAATLVAVVALAAWLAGAGSGGSATPNATIHVVEHALTDAVTNGKKVDAVGNLLTFANPVFDAADARKVGTDSGYCVRIKKKRTWECSWTTFLSDGQITVQGPFSDKGNTKLAITGGTGSYESVQGWMELNYHNAKGTKFDFVFHTS